MQRPSRLFALGAKVLVLSLLLTAGFDAEAKGILRKIKNTATSEMNSVGLALDQIPPAPHSAPKQAGGGGSPDTWVATPGERLGCLSGRAGSSIDQIYFVSTGSN